mgnify:CR=1 FL=1
MCIRDSVRGDVGIAGDLDGELPWAHVHRNPKLAQVRLPTGLVVWTHEERLAGLKLHEGRVNGQVNLLHVRRDAANPLDEGLSFAHGAKRTSSAGDVQGRDKARVYAKPVR